VILILLSSEGAGDRDLPGGSERDSKFGSAGASASFG
jgi:hypothetical protein